MSSLNVERSVKTDGVDQRLQQQTGDTAQLHLPWTRRYIVITSEPSTTLHHTVVSQRQTTHVARLSPAHLIRLGGHSGPQSPEILEIGLRDALFHIGPLCLLTSHNLKNWESFILSCGNLMQVTIATITWFPRWKILIMLFLWAKKMNKD